MSGEDVDRYLGLGIRYLESGIRDLFKDINRVGDLTIEVSTANCPQYAKISILIRNHYREPE